MKPKVGLALGGGAARGFAHIGVIRVLEEETIPVAAVSGTSVGSLMGLLYCSGRGWERIDAVSRPIRWRDLLSLRLNGMGLYCTDKLEQLIEAELGRIEFEDLEIPLAIVAVDVSTGEEVILDSGPAGPAVCASTAVPGVFCPREIDGRMLIDGGMRNSVPSNVVRKMGAEIVIGVDLNWDRVRKRKPANLFQVVSNTVRIVINNNLSAGEKSSDILVKPDLRDFGYRSLDHKEEMIDRGEESMRAELPRLKRLIETYKERRNVTT